MATCWFCYKESGEKEYHSRCSRRFFGTPEPPELILNDKLLQQLVDKTVNQRIAITGVQPKLSVTLQPGEGAGKENRLTIVGLWGEYILKPQHHDYPQMPETEDLTMHLASIFKLKVCEHALIRASDNSLVYLAKRFDRKDGKKIHMEDLCQLSEFPTESKYKSSYEKAGKLVSRYCTNTGLDTLAYFELVLFCYLSGNNDMHLKNFALLHHAGSIDFSPAYDLLNVNLVNPEDKEELALTLNGKKNRIRLADFSALAASLKIPDKVRDNTYKKFSARNIQVHDMIGRSFLTQDSKAQYSQIWNRKQELFG